MFDLRPRLVHSPQNRRTFFNTSVELPCPVCGGVVAFGVYDEEKALEQAVIVC